MIKDIKDIPDYAVLKKLAVALWQQESAYNGAAVMIGAGFSRAGAFTGDANLKLPLWNDLSKILEKDLDGSGSLDPLRLAEEYCAFFGKQALHDVIKKEIRDFIWQPGELHKSLLELPWSEVLTTNWDTLLERASIEVNHPVYNLISKQEDLSNARSPRIVKLHGTANLTEDLIFTQEDYRKYPQKYAAFVNFVRQVFIENELCLLGFSGDDPNFLQWAGWVRDHLAGNARRIYLVGALGLTVAKRKYLESINVAPIDLSVLVSEYEDNDKKHSAATKKFIQALQDLKPIAAWEWKPTKLRRNNISGEELDSTSRNPDHAAKLLENQIPTLAGDRASYPGWLVCPEHLRWDIQKQINDPYPSSKNISKMGLESRAKLLYEIVWRHDVTYEKIPKWMVSELFAICDPATYCGLTRRQQMEISLLLLKSTRFYSDKVDKLKIEAITTEILEREIKHWPECVNDLAYHHAMVARDEFNYPALEKLVEKIIASDPIWMLRKSSLLAELGRSDEAVDLINCAYREFLNQHRKNKTSIYIFSRLAWSHWLFRGANIGNRNVEFKVFPSSYQEPKCSPWDQIEYINSQISKILVRQQKQVIEPSFEPGHYKDNSNTATFINGIDPCYVFDALSNSVGMPLRLGNFNFFADTAARLIELEGVDDEYRFSLAIRVSHTDTSDTLKKVFSRTKIASLSKERIDYLLNCYKMAVDYWGLVAARNIKRSKNYPLERLRVFIEVLARVSVRASPEQAKQLFLMAVSLGKKSKFQDSWLCDSLKHLLDYSLECIPKSQHQELLLSALSFPLPVETGLDSYHQWPNPIINDPGNRQVDSALDRRIDVIIDCIAPCGSQSASSLLRLLPLLENNFLTVKEKSKIAEKIWGEKPTYQELPETGLFNYALLILPSLDFCKVKSLVNSYLYGCEDGNLFSSFLLKDIANGRHLDNGEGLPTKEQAINYFDRLVSWRDTNHREDSFWSEQQDDELGKLIGEVLARVIVPSMPTDAFNAERFEKLRAFYADLKISEVIIALPYFAAKNIDFIEEVERIIKRGLISGESNMVAYSSYALLNWKGLNSSQVSDSLISRLVYQVESNRMIGLPALLWTSNEMYKKGFLSKHDVESLVDNLPVIFDSADYDLIDHYSRKSISVSLVRAACVRLAKSIVENGCANDELFRILDEAKYDALPEVRFAEEVDI